MCKMVEPFSMVHHDFSLIKEIEDKSFFMFQPNYGQARILIADDDVGIRSMLHEVLSESFECVAVGSAEEALAQLRNNHFNLVISDIMMTGMTGLEMVPHILRHAPDTIVILMSGMQTIESAIEALRVGAFDYVMKPFDIRHVESTIRRALEHQELRQAKARYERHLEELVKQRTTELDHALYSLENSYRTTLKALVAALEMRDTETYGHSERVVTFSLRLGRELQLDNEQMAALELGALLHDIGKIGVPDAVLRKPGKLTDDEWVKMREHPTLGQQILRGIEFLGGASHVVGEHHERWDGAGYPLGLRGEQIDLKARIFSVADAFDAMISDRVYRPGRSYEEAVAELNRCTGTQFDPKLVEAFHRVPREEWEEMRRRVAIKTNEVVVRHPVGSLLEARMFLLAG